MPSRAAAPITSLVLMVTLAGCILPIQEDRPGAVSMTGSVPPRTVPPGVKLSLSFETSSHPDPVLKFQAWAENQAASALYTRGNCYSPWSWTLTHEGEPVERGPPTVTCDPISWADFPSRSNQTWSAGWNGTVWGPDEGTNDFEDGDYEPAPEGDYVATIRFAFYRDKNADRYCCPELAENDIHFTLR